MRLLTADGRRIARDMQRMQFTRGLRQHEWFRGVPPQVINGIAELILVSKELRAKIKTEGVTRDDGTINPCVEAFRQYKTTELKYLTAIAEMRRAEHNEPLDLVAQMAKVVDGVEAAAADESPSEDAPAEQAPSSERDDPQT